MEKMKSFGEALKEKKDSEGKPKKKKKRDYSDVAEGVGKALSARNAGDAIRAGGESIAKQIVKSRKKREEANKRAESKKEE